MPINVTGQQYLIFDSSISVTIYCIAVPEGIPPKLTYTPFTNNSSIPFVPIYQTTNAAYVEFLGGFAPPVSGIYTCTSEIGYSVTSYIANPTFSGTCSSVHRHVNMVVRSFIFFFPTSDGFVSDKISQVQFNSLPIGSMDFGL